MDTSDSFISPPPANCFAVCYKARHLSSKLAILVLVWNCLLWGAFEPSNGNQQELTMAAISKDSMEYLILIIPQFFWFAFALPSTWLTGRYSLNRVIYVGIAVMWMGTILDTIVAIIAAMVEAEDETTWVIAMTFISDIIVYTGSAPALVHLIQLGIEQMPEASNSQISSFVSWVVFSISLGIWINLIASKEVYRACIGGEYHTLFKLLPVLLLTAILCTGSIFKDRLKLHSAPSNTPQLIYNVLRYATQHKYPEKRSALSYWEDEIPSRINLGKKRYGGPFSNEQVEDVKTFFRLLALFLTMLASLIALYTTSYEIYYNNIFNLNAINCSTNCSTNCSVGCPTECTKKLVIFTLGSDTWWMMVLVLAYELLLYPLANIQMPVMFRRIGFVFLINMMLSFFFMVLKLIFFVDNTHDVTKWSMMTAIAFTYGLIKVVFFTASLELICAQSPYNMRNFFISLSWCLYRLSSLIAGLVFSGWEEYCTDDSSCHTYYSAYSLLLTVTAFAMYCLVAKWYKLRERGDNEETHQRMWVEDAYIRYLARKDTLRNVARKTATSAV